MLDGSHGPANQKNRELTIELRQSRKMHAEWVLAYSMRPKGGVVFRKQRNQWRNNTFYIFCSSGFYLGAGEVVRGDRPARIATGSRRRPRRASGRILWTFFFYGTEFESEFFTYLGQIRVFVTARKCGWAVESPREILWDPGLLLSNWKDAQKSDCVSQFYDQFLF